MASDVLTRDERSSSDHVSRPRPASIRSAAGLALGTCHSASVKTRLEAQVRPSSILGSANNSNRLVLRRRLDLASGMTMHGDVGHSHVKSIRPRGSNVSPQGKIIKLQEGTPHVPCPRSSLQESQDLQRNKRGLNVLQAPGPLLCRVFCVQGHGSFRLFSTQKSTWMQTKGT